MTGCPLSDALIRLLPDAIVTRRRESDWHSATFSGKQLILDLKTSAPEPDIRRFADGLAEHEFSIPNLLVADIAVAAQQELADGVLLTVEALLLEEDV
jgi:hypothetical protein